MTNIWQLGFWPSGLLRNFLSQNLLEFQDRLVFFEDSSLMTMDLNTSPDIETMKVVLLGSLGCGKTSIIHRACRGTFNPEPTSSVCSGWNWKTLNSSEGSVRLDIGIPLDKSDTAKRWRPCFAEGLAPFCSPMTLPSKSQAIAYRTGMSMQRQM
jgi:hypothetical protein